MKDLGDRHAALAQEVVILQVDVERLNLLQDIRHFIDGVLSTLRSGAVAADARRLHHDFHAAALTAVNAAIRRLGADDKFGAEFPLLDNVLPAKPIAILFLDGTDYNQRVVSFESKILDDFSRVDHRGHAALLVAGTASAYGLGILAPLVRIKFPVCHIADANGVDMCIHCDNVFAMPDGAEDIPHWVDFNLVKTNLLHLLFDAQDDFLLLRALTWNRNHVPQELCHLGFIFFCLFHDLCKIHVYSSSIHNSDTERYPLPASLLTRSPLDTVPNIRAKAWKNGVPHTKRPFPQPASAKSRLQKLP